MWCHAKELLLLLLVVIVREVSNAPVISSIRPSNMPAVGGGDITYLVVQGSNFGFVTSNIRVGIGTSLSPDVSNAADSLVICKIPAGTGAGLDVFVNVSGEVTTLVRSFSYDPPLLTSLVPNNIPTAGSTAKVLGKNFGTSNVSPIVQMAGTLLQSVWTSDSSVEISVPQGAGGMKWLSVSVSNQVYTAVNVLSYSTPRTDQVQPEVIETKGALVSISGSFFGVQDYTLSSKSGFTHAEFTQWTSDSALRCEIASGVGCCIDLSVTAANQEGITLAATSFYAPALSGFQMDPLSTTLATSLNLNGSSFGIFDFTMQTRVGQSASMFTRWNSETSCFAASTRGIGGNLRVIASVARQIGTSNSILSYTSPKLNSVSPLFGSPLGGFVMSLTGSSFGGDNYSPVVQIGMSTCQTYFVSDSSTRVIVKSGVGENLAVSISTQGQIGVWSSFFSYLAPNVTSVTPANSPTSGSLQVSIFGSNFGSSSQPDQNVVIGKTSCSLILWKSDSSMNCVVPRGTRSSLDVSVRSGGLVGTLTAGFSFDAPVIESVFPGIAATVGGQSITVIGKNFGVFGSSSVTVKVGYTTCSSSAYGLNEYMLICVLAPGAGIKLTVYVALDGGSFTGQANSFSYSPPILTAVKPPLLLPAGHLKLTLSGQGFGTASDSQSAAVQSTVSQITYWVSDSSLPFLYAAGTGSGRSVSLSVGDQRHSLANTATFSSPLLSSARPSNVPALQPTTEIAGQCFVAFDTTAAVRVQGDRNWIGSASLRSQWTSDSSLLCKLTSGVGVLSSLRVSVASFDGSISSALSFDLPKVKSGLPFPNLPKTGMTRVSLVGLDFGNADYSAASRIGQTACWSNAWWSDTSLICGVSTGLVIEKVVVSILDSVGSSADALSYDLQTVTLSSRYNLRSDTEVALMLSGVSFGSWRPNTIQMSVGFSPCASTAWTSSSSIACLARRGVGLEADVKLVVESSVQIQRKFFSYELPTTSHVQPANLPTSSSAAMPVFGAGFAQVDYTPKVRGGRTQAEMTRWLSQTSAVCQSSSQIRRTQQVITTLQVSFATTSNILSFDTIEVTCVNSLNSALFPSILLLLSSNNMYNKFKDMSVKSRIGSTSFPYTEWSNNQQVVCKASSTASGSQHVVLSLSTSLLSSLSHAFSFSSISIVPPQIPLESQKVTSFLGTGIGYEDRTLSLRVGLTGAQQTVWKSYTTIWVKVSAGVGRDLRLVASASSVLATSSNFNQFALPLTSSTTPSNSPPARLSQIIFLGTDFGSTSYSQTVRVGSTSCCSTKWTSSSSLASAPSFSMSNALTVVVTSGLQPGTALKVFSFDSCSISSVHVQNVPTVGNRLLSLSGESYGVSSYSLRPSLSFSVLPSALWTSDTTIVCKIIAGVGREVPFAVAQGAAYTNVGTLSDAISYDSPQLSSLSLQNMQQTSPALITIFGSVGFGSADYSSIVISLNDKQALLSTWTSDTSVSCRWAPGQGDHMTLQVNFQNEKSPVTEIFTFDSPSLSTACSSNLASSKQFFVFGYNFGVVDLSIKARVGTSGQQTVWQSYTSVVAVTGQKEGASFSMIVTTWQRDGTMSAALSYSMPLLSTAILANSAAMALNALAIFDSSQIPIQLSDSIRIGFTACEQTSWMSGTQIFGKLSAGTSKTIGIVLTHGISQGSLSQAHSYDFSVMIVRTNLPSSGEMIVLLPLLSYHPSCYTPTARMVSALDKTRWASDTSISCSVQVVSGNSISFQITTGRSVFSATDATSFDRIALSSVSGGNIAARGQVVNIFSSFLSPYPDFTLSTRLGASKALETLWLSSTSLSGKTASASGHSQSITFSLASIQGSTSEMFSQDSSRMSVSLPGNFFSPAIIALSLRAPAIGVASHSISVRTGLTSSSRSAWISDSAIQATAASGVGGSLAQALTVVMQASSLSQLLSYDRPTLSSRPANSPTTGNINLGLTGAGLGSFDACPVAQVERFVCRASMWQSDTSMVCRMNEGAGSGLDMSVKVKEQ
eukprot:764669-Hanusia_phi.AAC.1